MQRTYNPGTSVYRLKAFVRAAPQLSVLIEVMPLIRLACRQWVCHLERPHLTGRLVLPRIHSDPVKPRYAQQSQKHN